VTPQTTAASNARVVDGSSVAYGERRLFVLATDALREYRAGVTGTNPKPIATFAFPAAPAGTVWVPVDTVEAPDRTVYALFYNKSTGFPTVVAYAPNTTTIEEQFQLPHAETPLSIALVGDGIDVSTEATLYTYPYDAGNTPVPVRTLNVRGPVVTDSHDQIYAWIYSATPGGDATVSVYAPASSGNAAPSRVIDAGARYLNRIIVGPDKTIYGSFSDPLASFSVVQTIPRDGTKPRIVAEYPSSNSGSAAFVYSMSVDSDNDLYVGAGTTPDVEYLVQLYAAHVDVYGPRATYANGRNAPLQSATGLAPAGKGLVAIATGR
jgi:hypothetical protein